LPSFIAGSNFTLRIASIAFWRKEAEGGSGNGRIATSTPQQAAPAEQNAPQQQPAQQQETKQQPAPQ
jgi:hypothetical protein